jgi:serine phosphatase RsbU (regulator of sigma subunit)/predicted enzyme related to lactoylglutathione lyase
MAEESSALWWDRPTVRLDRAAPHLRIFFSTVFVRDQDRSVKFFTGQLGFRLIADNHFDGGGRWVAVGPADGTAFFALVTPDPGTAEFSMIGGGRQVVLITEDIDGLYEDWRQRGVNFRHEPKTPIWGGRYTEFWDPDGNSFVIVGSDEISRSIEGQRQRLLAKAEEERRLANELEIAKQVQARLFPTSAPQARTLEYAGACVQARHVGGDYYDFLNLGRDRLGLVIGDVSGKGIAASLMMAHLQASLRSQCAIAVDQPQVLFHSLNQLFCENTIESAYATFFFAEYDDATQKVRYANCGHLPALIIRSDGRVEKLESTATVIGLFREWNCTIDETQLHPGDILALYTDGVTEAFNDAYEEFGEDRLVEALARHRVTCPTPQSLLQGVLDELREFSPNEQSDDITLVVAICRTN